MATGLDAQTPRAALHALAARWPAFAIGAGLLVWFGSWLLAAEPRMGTGVTNEFYPRLAYAMAELRRGAIPWWGPHTMAGTPLLANPQLGLLYPLHWPLLALLPVGPSLNYAAILHVALAAGGTYGLGRRWALSSGAAAFAAVAFAFSGFFVLSLWAGNFNLLEAYAWLPLLLLAADCVVVRRSLASWGLLAGAVTLSLTVGLYQPWYIAMLAVAGYLVAMPGTLRDRLWRLVALGAAGVVAVGLAAPQLLPAYELIQWTARSGRLPWEFATDASLPPWHLPGLALPELFGSGAGTYWPGPWWHWHERTAYVGLLPLVLLPLGLARPRVPWVRYCAVLALVGLVLALGRYTPVYGWLYDWVPGYGSFRDPARHLVLSALAVALLAGRGVDRLAAGRGRLGVMAALLGIVVTGALVAVVAVQAADRGAPAVVPLLRDWGLWGQSASPPNRSETEMGAAVLLLVGRACSLAVVAAAIAMIVVLLGRRCAPGWRAALLVGAVFVDLSLFSWRYLQEPLPIVPGLPFGAPEAQFAAFFGEDNVARLRQQGGLWRVAVLGKGSTVAGNAGYILGVPLAIGLDPLLPRRYAELVAQIDGVPLDAFAHVAVFLDNRPSALWPLLNARYRLVPRPGAVGADLPAGFDLEERPEALPRAFVAATVRLAPSADASLAALADPSFDPARVVVLEAGLDDPAGALAGLAQDASSPATRVEVQHYEPGDVTVAADAPAGGALVLLEAWHPGWQALVDGEDARVYPADHAFMGVALPPGSHQVRFRFRSLWWGVGLVVMLATAAAMSLVVALRALRPTLWSRAARRLA
ncbi:MAG TPA: YfhO family protein [Chloroflexota bacterium]